VAYDVAGDMRLDPRLKAILASIPAEPAGDVDSREVLLAEANSEAARQEAEQFRSFMELCDSEDAAPSAGLRVHTEKVVSAPDGNSIAPSRSRARSLPRARLASVRHLIRRIERSLTASKPPSRRCSPNLADWRRATTTRNISGRSGKNALPSTVAADAPRANPNQEFLP